MFFKNTALTASYSLEKKQVCYTKICRGGTSKLQRPLKISGVPHNFTVQSWRKNAASTESSLLVIFQRPKLNENTTCFTVAGAWPPQNAIRYEGFKKSYFQKILTRTAPDKVKPKYSCLTSKNLSIISYSSSISFSGLPVANVLFALNIKYTKISKKPTLSGYSTYKKNQLIFANGDI